MEVTTDTALSNQVLYTTLVGAFLPMLIAVIVQAKWSSKVKATIALLVCVAAGVGVAYYQGAMDPKDIGRSVMLVIIAAKTLYESYWKPAGIAAGIEKATTPGP